MTNKIQINLRVTEELKNKIQEQAGKEGRSVNNLIEYVMNKYIEQQNNETK